MDEREITIEVPVRQNSPDIEMNVVGGTIDLGDLVNKLGAGRNKARTEKRRMKVKDVSLP